ncbi:MAG: hypothetical protein FWF84_07565 [Kiritimatiellaeota bacterium]|nr:hypothetical protein [Kiritimatiellota bacterium]
MRPLRSICPVIARLPPLYDDETAAIKSLDGADYPGKIVFMNDMDVDGDGIPDFLDGYMPISGIAPQNGENAYDRIVNGKFVPLVLLRADPDVQMTVTFQYDANDPSNPEGKPTPPTPLTMTLARAQEIAEACATANPLPGRIRIWTKDAFEHRNPASFTLGGDFIQTNVTINVTDLFAEGAKTAVVYVEGIGTSDDWGTDKIKVETKLTTPPGYPVSSITMEDSVSYTVVRNVYKVCVFRPYVCERNEYDDWNITERRVFRPRYGSVQTMLDDYLEGQAKFDDIAEEYHDLGASMGHAFARIEIRQPNLSTNYWTGHTGLNIDEATGLERIPLAKDTFTALLRGRTFWYRAPDGREDKQEKCAERYNDLYHNVIRSSAYITDSLDNKVKKMVAAHEFRIRPETAQALHDYRNSHPFNGYGLDVTLNGVNDSCVGCGSYIGLLTEASGLLTPSQVHTAWVYENMAFPVIRLPTVAQKNNSTLQQQLELASVFDAYSNSNSIPLIEKMLEIHADALADISAALANPSTLRYRPLKFCDPSKMMDWVDDKNSSTPWQQGNLQYKDRGVTVEYGVPAPSPLDAWRNRR